MATSGRAADGGDPRIDTSVAHSARVHDYWLGGKDNFVADRAAGDAVIGRLKAAMAPGSYLALSQVAADIETEQVAEARLRYNSLARETQRHRTRAEVTRFFDGLDLVEPGVVPVQRWRPASDFGARAKSTMWGGVARR